MIQADIELSNPKKPKLKGLKARALVVSPSGRSITVNPKSSNIPSAVVKTIGA